MAQSSNSASNNAATKATKGKAGGSKKAGPKKTAARKAAAPGGNDFFTEVNTLARQIHEGSATGKVIEVKVYKIPIRKAREMALARYKAKK